MSRTVRSDGPAGGRSVVALAPLGLVLVLGVGIAGCGTTVIEDSGTTVVTDQTTTTTDLPSTVDGRFAEIVLLSTGLGNLIADGGDSEVIDRIDALWAASSAAVASIDPGLGRDVTHQLELLHVAVERNRPADADKSSRNLAELLQTFRDRTPDG
jgi:hypothetical protein